MNIYDGLITYGWIIFMLYWLLASFSAKKSLRGHSWWRGAYVRLGVAVVLILLFRTESFRKYLIIYARIDTNYITATIGAALFLLGIALAVWARVYLGRNWGMPTTIKEKPELVTSGPYSYIRHPIYSGFLLAMLGTSLTVGFIWLVLFVVMLIYFIYSATVEEKNMTRLFPDTYPEYRKNTKMIIPFVL